MTEVTYMRNILNRMAVFLLSFGFCASYGMAQSSLSERLNYVIETQDIENGIKLYNEISEADLKQKAGLPILTAVLQLLSSLQSNQV